LRWTGGIVTHMGAYLGVYPAPFALFISPVAFPEMAEGLSPVSMTKILPWPPATNHPHPDPVNPALHSPRREMPPLLPTVNRYA
jgi:hypothetical protein